MSNYTIEDLREALDENGELIISMDSDGYPENPELHLHDTTLLTDPPEVVVELADGTWSFKPSHVESIATHKQTTDDLGM